MWVKNRVKIEKSNTQMIIIISTYKLQLFLIFPLLTAKSEINYETSIIIKFVTEFDQFRLIQASLEVLDTCNLQAQKYFELL